MQAALSRTQDTDSNTLTVEFPGFIITAFPVNPRRTIPPLPALQWSLRPLQPRRLEQQELSVRVRQEGSSASEELSRQMLRMNELAAAFSMSPKDNSTPASRSIENNGNENGKPPSKPASTTPPSSPTFKTAEVLVLHMDGDSCPHCGYPEDQSSGEHPPFDVVASVHRSFDKVRAHINPINVEPLTFVKGRLPPDALRRDAVVLRKGVLDYTPSDHRKYEQIHILLGVIPLDEIAREIDKKIKTRDEIQALGLNIGLVF